MNTLYRWHPNQETLLAALLFILFVCVNVIANLLKGSPYFILFYQGFLMLGLGILTPLCYIRITKQRIYSIGLTLKNWKKAVVVGALLILVSVPWRFIENDYPAVNFGVIVSTSLALVMASFCEEVFFRGFLQTRFEKAFGVIPSIILSGVTFSLYHVGYPDYQDEQMLFVLFAVGTFFAIAFKITNNVITSFLVNFPHAIISFMEKQSYFSEEVAIVSVVTTILGLFFIYYFHRYPK